MWDRSLEILEIKTLTQGSFLVRVVNALSEDPAAGGTTGVRPIRKKKPGMIMGNEALKEDLCRGDSFRMISISHYLSDTHSSCVHPGQQVC